MEEIMFNKYRPVILGVFATMAAIVTGCGGGGGNGSSKVYNQVDRLARPAVNEVFATVANNQHQINDQDRVIIGHGSPKGWGSFVNNFHYKQFDLLLEIAYMYGNDVLNQTHHSGEDRTGIANSFSSVLDHYEPGKNNNNTMIAATRDTRAGYVTNVDTRWVEDGSFIRGKNLSLSYNFPTSMVQNLKLNRLRMYVSVQNFFLKTKFSGNDPEVTTYSQAFAQGQTFFDYPKPTVYMLGVNVGL